MSRGDRAGLGGLQELQLVPGHRDAFADVVGKPAELLIGYQFCSRPGCVVTPLRVAAGTGMRAVISNRGHAKTNPGAA
jgi:hypothetical protein